jgi:glycosyltransferase involved in cell wall biosynthesis
MTSDPVRFSVIIPVHNGDGDLLVAAARSVLAQGPVLERLIVVDDGSTAETTRAALRKLAALPRVQVITLPTNQGVSAARNAGIDAAPSPWIGLCDADDLMAPGWLDTAAAAIPRYPQAQMVLGRRVVMWKDGAIAGEQTMVRALGRQFDQDGTALHSGPEFVRTQIGTLIGHICAILVTKALAQRVGGFNTKLAFFEDWLFRFRCCALTAMIELDTLAYVYRRGLPSVTTSARSLSEDWVRGWSIARKCPLLKDYRRELRWAEYSARKALTLRNLYRGNKLQALRFALSALAIDPREIKDFLAFLRLMRLPPELLLTEGQGYSRMPVDERLMLSDELAVDAVDLLQRAGLSTPLRADAAEPWEIKDAAPSTNPQQIEALPSALRSS